MSKRAEEAAMKAYPDYQATNATVVRGFHRSLFIEGYEQAEKDIIERAIDWLKNHINIPQSVVVNEDGEPFADSYIAYAKERLETANRICEDFKKAMEQD